jgi:hypothetical protein
MIHPNIKPANRLALLKLIGPEARLYVALYQVTISEILNSNLPVNKVSLDKVVYPEFSLEDENSL